MRGEGTTTCDEAPAATLTRRAARAQHHDDDGWLDRVRRERSAWLDADALDELFDAPESALATSGLYLRASGAPGLLYEQQEQAIRRAGEAIDEEIERRFNGWSSALERMRRREQARYRAAREQAQRCLREYRAERCRRLARMLAKHDIRLRSRDLADPNLDQAAYERCNAIDPDLWFELDTRLVDVMQSSPQMLALREAEQRLDHCRSRLLAAESDWWRAKRETALDVLRETRRFGGVLEHRHYREDAFEATVALDEAARYLPNDWIRASNTHNEDAAAHPLLVLGAEGRSSYRHRGVDELGRGCGILSLNLSKRGRVADDPDGTATAAHELAHRFEHVLAELKALEWTFYNRRTRGGSLDGELEPSRPLSDYYPECLPGERTREDHFTRPYIGRVNGEDTIGSSPSASFEVLALALEDLVSGRIGVIERDRDMRTFLWGVLALV